MEIAKPSSAAERSQVCPNCPFGGIKRYLIEAGNELRADGTMDNIQKRQALAQLAEKLASQHPSAREMIVITTGRVKRSLDNVNAPTEHVSCDGYSSLRCGARIER